MQQLTHQQQQIIAFLNKARRDWQNRSGNSSKTLRRLNFACEVWQNTGLFTEEQRSKYNYWRDIKSVHIRQALISEKSVTWND